MALVIGKSKVVKPDVIHQTILPSSFAEFHPAMQWDKTCYAGNRFVDGHGEFALKFKELSTVEIIALLPSVPKSWEMIYGVRN